MNVPSPLLIRVPLAGSWHAAQEVCAEEVPELVDRGTGHPAACYFPQVEFAPEVPAERRSS